MSAIPNYASGSDQQNAIIISSGEVGLTSFLTNGRKRRKLNGSVSTIYDFSSDEDLSFKKTFLHHMIHLELHRNL